MPDLGKAYVQIVPSAQGISGSISSLIGGEASSAGTSAGGLLGGNLIKTLSGVVAAAGVGKMITDTISTGMDFDSSMSQVAATMGLTMDEMADSVGTVDLAWGTFSGNLREYAQEMGAHTAFSAKESADALNYMALAGYDVQTSMEMLPNVLNLAAAGGMDLARASDMITDASSALGLSIDETSQMVDKMARASSRSNTSVEQLGDAILTIGGTAKDLSGGTTELSTALGILADNGIKGSEAGTHLRNIMLSLTPKSEDAAAAMEALGFNAYNADGSLRPLQDTFGDLAAAMDGMSTEERTQMLSSMFNKTDLASINALLATSSERWDELAQAIDGAWYTSTALDTALEPMGMSLESMQANLEGLGITAEEFSAALDTSGGNAGQFAEDLAIASDDGVMFDDIVNAMGGDLDGLQAAFDSTTGAAQAMADTQLDNLSGDITLFKSALEGVKIAISDAVTPALRDFVTFGSSAMEQITNGIKTGGEAGLGEALGNIIAHGIEMLAGFIPQMLTAGTGLIGGLLQGFAAAGPNILTAIQGVYTNLTTTLTAGLPEMLAQGVEIINSIVNGILQGLPELLSTGGETMTSYLGAILEAIPQILEAGTQILMNLIQGISTTLPQLITIAGQIMTQLVSTFLSHLPEILQQGVQIVMKLANGVLQALPAVLEAAAQVMAQIVTTILSHLPEILAKGIEMMAQLAAGIIRGIPDLVKKIPEVINSIKDAFMDFDWLELGKDILKGIAEGISKGASIVGDALSSVAGGAVDKLKGLLGIGSPSTVMRDEVGQWIPAGVALGIRQNLGLIDEAMAGAALSTASSYQRQMTGWAPGQLSSGSTDETLRYILELLITYFPEFAKNQGRDGQDIYGELNRRLGMAVYA